MDLGSLHSALLEITPQAALAEFNRRVKRMTGREDYAFRGGYTDVKVTVSEDSSLKNLINLVKSIHKIEDSNYLSWEDRFANGTGYVQNISVSDLKSRQVVWFLVPPDRVGIAFQCVFPKTEFKASSCEIVSLFPHRVRHNLVMSSCNNEALNLSSPVTDSDFHQIQTLLKGEILKTDDREFHLPTQQEMEDYEELSTKRRERRED